MARALRVMRLILAAATIAVCLLLCWQASDVYLAGNSPDNFSAPGVRIDPVYSREIVAGRLAAVSPALFGYLALVAAGLALQAFAGGKAKPRAAFLAEDKLRGLRRRVAAVPPEAEVEQRRRRNIRLTAGAVICACTVLAGSYLLNPENFASLDLESVVGSMMLHVSPWVVLALAAAAAASVLNGQSVLREIEILKAAPQEKIQAEAVAEKKSAIPAVRIALYAAAAVFIVLGVMNGGLWDVLVKAVNICTECIGLG